MVLIAASAVRLRKGGLNGPAQDPREPSAGSTRRREHTPTRRSRRVGWISNVGPTPRTSVPRNYSCSSSASESRTLVQNLSAGNC